jgi:D-3-phosphoglycerate dehydrogenase
VTLPPYKILVTDVLPIDPASVEGAEIAYRPGLPRAELLALIGEYDALVTRSATRVDDELLRAGRRLRVVGRGGVGVDNIDIEAASRRGILVVNAPEANTLSAAEHTVAMLLALAKNLPEAARSVREGRWERGRLGVEVAGKTLGIIGLGRIGGRVARRARALEMKVCAYDPYIAVTRADELRVQLVELDELLQAADFLTLHVPLTDETRGMIGASELARLPRGARVINCARGGVIDESALAAALDSGQVAGAALDVLASEPPEPGNPLAGRADVIVTPHLGGSTLEAHNRIGSEILRATVNALRGDLSAGAVNAPALDARTRQILDPYLRLGERLGKFLSQLAPGRTEQFTVEFLGSFPADPDPVAIAAVKGFLEPILQERPNYINARAIAKERGVRVTTTTSPNASDYVNVVRLTVRTDQGESSVSGTTFGADPRIVQFDAYRLEAVPDGPMLIVRNLDVPGVVGALGQILGDAGVNISGLALGRDAPGGRALVLVNLDELPGDHVLERIREMPNVVFAQAVVV